MKYCVPFALLGAPLVFQSFGAHAQTAEKRMETISVSATLREADIEDIPASVDVLSADDIDTANGLNSAEDITRLLRHWTLQMSPLQHAEQVIAEEVPPTLAGNR